MAATVCGLRTVRTGQGAFRTTFSAVEPRRACSRPLRPCVPKHDHPRLPLFRRPEDLAERVPLPDLRFHAESAPGRVFRGGRHLLLRLRPELLEEFHEVLRGREESGRIVPRVHHMDEDDDGAEGAGQKGRRLAGGSARLGEVGREEDRLDRLHARASRSGWTRTTLSLRGGFYVECPALASQASGERGRGGAARLRTLPAGTGCRPKPAGTQEH